jgi:tetratricopeptide (TPR) repeat protein
MQFFLVPFLLFSVLTYSQSERSILYDQATEFGYRNQFKESERVLSKIIELYPNDSTAYFDRAIMRENLGDTLGALSDLSKEIQIDPKSADNYFLRGMLYQKSKMYAQALSDFRTVNRLDDGNADAYFFAAQMCQELNKPKRIIRKRLNACLNVNPNHEEATKMQLILN